MSGRQPPDCWDVLALKAERRAERCAGDLRRAQHTVEQIEASCARVRRLQEDYHARLWARQRLPHLASDGHNDRLFIENLAALLQRVEQQLPPALAQREAARLALAVADLAVLQSHKLQERAAQARVAEEQRREAGRLADWATLRHGRGQGGESFGL
jgi:flagellar export protein FliJ